MRDRRGNVAVIPKNKKVKTARNNLNFNRKRREKKQNNFKGLFLFIFEVAFVIVLAWHVADFFGHFIYSNNVSMEPTIGNNNTLLLNTIIYKYREPKVYDVIAFYPAGNANANISVKRVVAVPGDTVLIDNGRLYVNGEKFADRTITESMNFYGLASSEIKVREGELFVLGDNRNMSEDSRFETVGMVNYSYIVGKVWADATGEYFGLIR